MLFLSRLLVAASAVALARAVSQDGSGTAPLHVVTLMRSTLTAAPYEGERAEPPIREDRGFCVERDVIRRR